MERSPHKNVKIWSQTRAGSYLLLAFSVAALMYVAKVSIDFFTLQAENLHLLELKQQIINENIQLTSDNPYLENPDYASIYVRDNYLYDGKKFKKIRG